MRAGTQTPPRRGTALVVALVALMLVGILGGVLVRRGLEANRRAALSARQAQVAALWQSGLDRARARLAADPAYAGETWAIPAASLGGRESAKVTIRVRPAPNGPARATIQAEFPLESAAPSRTRREVTIEAGQKAQGGSSS